MRSILLTLVIIGAAIGCSLWVLDHLNSDTDGTLMSADSVIASSTSSTDGSALPREVSQTPTPAIQSSQNSQFDNDVEQLEQWLEQGRFNTVTDFINEQYSDYSSAQLEQIKRLFLSRGTRSDLRLERLNAAAQTFDDLDTWSALAKAAVKLRAWPTAHRALLRASQLQNDPTILAANLSDLVRVSSYLRAEMEQRGDELGIKSLYQEMYQLYPNFPRFQLELAYSHLRLGETRDAETLLNGLVYDPDLGQIATQTLARLQEDTAQAETLPTPSVSAAQRSDIVVPLVRSGNSFYIDTSINNRSTRMLLDTGASITALSSNLIQRLGLRPTGRTIQLSTANGRRSAKLYHADKLRLGRIELAGLQIAEIELDSNTGFEGLLGTDALNSVDNDFSYLIDNDKNALIFRRR